MLRVIGGICVAFWMFAGGIPTANAQARLALLIGNQNYANAVGPLRNPHNDVALMEGSLTRLGFNVKVLKDATFREMDVALQLYADELQKAGSGALGFFYYSGHGAADAATKKNYLIPIDVVSAQDASLWQRSYLQDDAIGLLNGKAPNAIQFVVFDACRNELPLPQRTEKAIWAASDKGFVPIGNVSGFLIAYSTGPGQTASDGPENGGPYASALADALSVPGVEVVTMFRDVQIKVKKRVWENQKEVQDPWLSFSALPLVYLVSDTKSRSVNRQVDIGSTFIPSGWMGDGQQGKQYISYDPDNLSIPHSPGKKSIKVTYTFGPQGWAGIYWQNTPNNWGSKRGNKYSDSGYSKITFWAKGASGGEVIDFKAGGVNKDGRHGNYQDSFFESTEGVELTSEWKQYSIDLRNADLSSVIGGFCWAASRNDNHDRSNITFYLEAITLE
jgi:Caspase domain